MSSDETQEFLQLFFSWRNDGLAPLVLIKGYTELLLKGEGGDLTHQQREFVEIIYRSCLRAVTLWHHPTDYLQIQAADLKTQMKSTQLADVINDAMWYLREYAQIEKVTIDLPASLPPVRGTTSLSQVFVYLIDSDTPYSFWKGQPTIIQAAQSEPSTIVIHIRTGLKLKPRYIGEPTEFFLPGSRASIADLIVRQHGSQVTLRPIGEGTEFQFSLQVWNEG
jgi:light-regulated signal transduction histidine kinase (bacteriophytochrome)